MFNIMFLEQKKILRQKTANGVSAFWADRFCNVLCKNKLFRKCLRLGDAKLRIFKFRENNKENENECKKKIECKKGVVRLDLNLWGFSQPALK